LENKIISLIQFRKLSRTGVRALSTLAGISSTTYTQLENGTKKLDEFKLVTFINNLRTLSKAVNRQIGKDVIEESLLQDIYKDLSELEEIYE
jgi:transcriptional regulator with XRE-family HTH domain